MNVNTHNPSGWHGRRKLYLLERVTVMSRRENWRLLVGVFNIRD